MRALYSLVLSFFLTLFGISAVLADHMTGRYEGVGEVAGTTLVLEQSGSQVTGRLSGGDSGTIVARSDGGDGFSGSITLMGVGELPAQGRWSPAGLVLTVAGANGTFNFEFRPSAAAPLERQTSSNDAPSAQPPAAFYYIVDGEQRGPVAQDLLIGLIEDGTVTRATLVWQPGQGEWQAIVNLPAFAELLPPPPPVDPIYYVLAEGAQLGPLTMAEVTARIEAGDTVSADLAWTSGLEAWLPIGEIAAFSEMFAAPVAPPPPPPLGAPETSDDVEDAVPPPPPVEWTPPLSVEEGPGEDPVEPAA